MSALILPEHDRQLARQILRDGVGMLMRAPSKIHYTKDYAKRWSAIHDELRIAKGQCLTYGDCSSTTTWLLWNALTHVHHHADVVNGERWLAGYTGTQFAHGRLVHHDANLRLGDLVFYGGSSSVPEHVAMSIGGGKVFSHGGEAGPWILPLDYRPDRHSTGRRYF